MEETDAKAKSVKDSSAKGKQKERQRKFGVTVYALDSTEHRKLTEALAMAVVSSTAAVNLVENESFVLQSDELQIPRSRKDFCE